MAGRDLPWRDPQCSPWGVLVSEVMLQQTPVSRVEPRWRAWMERWPTPSDLAVASTADVLRAWDRLGYPRRALRLQECAQAITAQHQGQVPRDEASLLALPGIGEYTAAAVASFAFGQRATVVDTNVRRVIARLVGGEAQAAPNLNSAERQRAASLVPAEPAQAARWAAASMELGALICTARTPACLSSAAPGCPVMDLCAWRLDDYPADEHAHRRRSQAWHGTDRQVRGKIMAALRQANHAVNESDLRTLLAASTPQPEPSQVTRCLATLIEDGLLEQTSADEDPQYALPA
ncbi:MAG: A/G-specific adenine glycosylase [Cellulomonadaceae bacterium]|jgi:A/G-specific adenine glycosylase|nr:A/G-specific adenine glycosylase [Cellulomonadaceae bacterium]